MRNSQRMVVAALLAATAGAASAHGLGYALTHGTIDLSLRPRYEIVKQPGKKEAHAFTLRTLLGYETASYEHLRVLLQLINVASFVNDYNSLLNHKTQYPVIPDAAATNVNQAYLSYSGLPATTMRAGRQIIVLNNGRFVGNVDFRQNMQTFDAVSLANHSLRHLTLYAAYSWRIKDILNALIPARVTLLNASYLFAPKSVASVYSYTYENRAHTVIPGAAGCDVPGGPAVCNSETAGIRVAGQAPITPGLRILYDADYAHQSPAGGGSALIHASYYHAGGGLGIGPAFVRVDEEAMGSNGAGTYGFQTPLATKHLFNGWAEVFLVTPPTGLRSSYVTVGGKLLGTQLMARYYRFQAYHTSERYGHEWDLSAIYPFRPGLVAGVQYADYRADHYAVNTRAAWVFVSYHY